MAARSRACWAGPFAAPVVYALAIFGNAEDAIRKQRRQ